MVFQKCSTAIIVTTNRLRPIEELEKAFAIYGNEGLNAACSEDIMTLLPKSGTPKRKEKQEILTFLVSLIWVETMVNWCAELGTVLANDEGSRRISKRGGFHLLSRRKCANGVCVYPLTHNACLMDWTRIEWTDSERNPKKLDRTFGRC